MPPTGFVMMTYDTCVHFIFFCFRRKVKGLRHERDESSRERPLRQQIQTIMLSQGAWPPESCWVAERVSFELQGQHAFHSNYNCCLKRSRTKDPRGYFRGFLCQTMRFSAGMFHGEKKNEACVLSLLFVCVSEVGAPPAE